MNSSFYNQIAKSSAHRKSRDDNKDFIFTNPNYLNDLTKIAFDTKDKNHHKACWILELICEEQIELFLPYINQFCEALPNFKIDKAIRPTSKICMFLSKNTTISLTEFQKEKIIETCLDRLIGNDKVASKVYAMRALFYFSKNNDWIKEEITNCINKDFSIQSAAYKAAAKEILKKINNQK